MKLSRYIAAVSKSRGPHHMRPHAGFWDIRTSWSAGSRVTFRARRSYSTTTSYTEDAEKQFEKDKEYYDALTKDKPVEVRMIPGKGRALFAKKYLKEGEKLWNEKPFIVGLSDLRTSIKYCWNCFVPLFEPEFVGLDEPTQQEIASGAISLRDEKTLAQVKQLYSALDIPLVDPKKTITINQQHNIHVCGPACHKEAQAELGPLLQAFRSNDPPVEAAQSLEEGGFVSFNMFSRILARATRDPRLVEDTMQRLVSSSKMGAAPRHPGHYYSLLLETFPEHRDWFTRELLWKWRSVLNLNSFNITTFPTEIEVVRDKSSKEGSLVMRVNPRADKDKAVRTIAVYTLGSLCNHSCDANVVHRVPFDATSHWYASRDIDAGDEILASYIASEDLSVTERRDKLKRSYEFDCQCPRCIAEEKLEGLF